MTAGAPRTRFVAGLLFVLVGASGIALGAALERFIFHRRMSHAFLGGHRHHEPPLAARAHMVRWLTSELKLSEAQQSQVDSILTRQDSSLHALMQEIRPHFDALADSAHQHIEMVLTPEQRERFRALGPRTTFHRHHGPPEGPDSARKRP